MARVKIEPGGKVLIALIILSALLFLFFTVIMSKGGRAPVPARSATEVAESAKAVPEQPSPAPVQQTAEEEAPEPAVRQGYAGPAKIFFSFNHARINKNVYCIFDRIQNAVRRESGQGLRIVVEGNADSIGPKWYNVQLSRMRAERVADSLSRRLGIPRSDIEIVANGFSKPIAPNSTPAGRAENRRTEVYIYP
ncbi:MAG: OmpA family protein [Bacteroidetes bacterium]|nr:OmpA family protein [Bacteroidota bacterium]